MLQNATQDSYRVWAVGSDYGKKDTLKSRGYKFFWEKKIWYIEIDKEQIVNLLLDELRILFGKKFSNIVFASAHRWRYARTINPLAKPYLCSPDNSLFVGGDWCLGSRVESAYQSGYAIANALIENRTK